MLGQQGRQHLQDGACLVVTVGRTLHDFGVHAERGAVDEDAPRVPVRRFSLMDEAQIDAEFDAVGQRLQTAGGILPVQAQVHGEVVARRRR